MALRHFKQRFDANEDFVYIKRMLVGGKSVNAGDVVDKDDFPGGKLKRMWHAQKIALADWKPPQTPGAARIEAERIEAERLEAEKLEAERLEAERLEAEKLEAEKLEAERIEAERLEAERLEAERLEAERLEAEKLEAERLEAEKIVPAIVEPDKVAAPTKPAKKKV